MLERFRSRLVAVLADPAIEGDDRTMSSVAHGIGGLAGMLGFDDLATGWLAVERDGRMRLSAARDATREALRMLDALIGPAPDAAAGISA